mgnify:CR=1 FL=1
MKAWSRTRTLGVGLGLIALTNAVALGGVWWNRAAIPESTLILSERELGLPWRALRNRENSGLALNLNWRVAEREAGEFISGYTVNGGSPEWLDAARMQALGFTVGDAGSDTERRRYTRQLPRAAIFVLELDGPAAQRALERARENAAHHAAAAAANAGNKEFAGRAKHAQDLLTQEENTSSRLFVIDAGLDAHALRQKYPDRTRFMLLHGTVRPSIRDRGPGQPQATGYVARVGSGPVHVPHALRGPLESLRARGEPGGGDRFSATLFVGQRLEPWIAEVTPPASAPLTPPANSREVPQ